MKTMLRILAGIALIQTLGHQGRAAPDPLETWTWRNPLPQGSQLLGVACGNEMSVAVGPNGAVVNSTDGIHWLLQNSGTTDSLDAITYGNGLFVVVGRNGTILSSPDGKAWSDHSQSPFHHFNAVTYGNHRFVAVGQKIIESDVNLATSDDGLNWTVRTIDAELPLTGVVFAHGLFVAVGCDAWGNGQFATSLDGLTWKTQGGAGVNSVAYGNGRFVAVGGDYYPPARMCSSQPTASTG